MLHAYAYMRVRLRVRMRVRFGMRMRMRLPNVFTSWTRRLVAEIATSHASVRPWVRRPPPWHVRAIHRTPTMGAKAIPWHVRAIHRTPLYDHGCEYRSPGRWDGYIGHELAILSSRKSSQCLGERALQVDIGCGNSAGDRLLALAFVLMSMSTR